MNSVKSTQVCYSCNAFTMLHLKRYLTIYAHSTWKIPEETQVLYCCNDQCSSHRPALHKYNM